MARIKGVGLDMEQSKKLEDTLLWKSYCEKISKDRERIVWVENVYNTAVVYLRDVRQKFKNYTLHDETHVLNVLDAMGGLLGDCVEKLTEGEMELLILAASIHDLGMVYTEEEEGIWLENERAYKDFLRTCDPEWIGCNMKDCPEDIQQWYLRVQHPFRIFEVLENKAWKELFEERPNLIVSTQCIEAVCRAHGEEPKDLRNNPELEYQAASDVDPLFCALLLRLADLLDFDDTRAPRVLFYHAENNDKSRGEWQKHQASAGFRFPAEPSVNELPYKARCKNPTIEHSVRKFLDWVDEELETCANLQKFCNRDWQRQFPFPRAILRKEIQSDGYMSGDFCLTMDQERVLHLLMGENLYDNRDVFVRELLQNAIDATLLRGEMERGFVPEEARIDFWEWMDREGNFWFRIDDYGTGMTLGMLQRYFLKVGNSYYMSQELKGDLYAHGGSKEYQGISRFGIGFLSCFLCGDYVEVSTLYFDPEKNKGEEETSRTRPVDYGLRLEVAGLTGYYTLKSQAERHPVGSLPMPEAFANAGNVGMERQGYRTKAGTSIVVRLNPGKLGTLNLRETVEKYLCAARMPVYYNNERVGRTYTEAMGTVHELAGERVYELSAELKREFDECFPEICGNYPKIAVTIISLDKQEDQIVSDLSGVLVKYDVRFEHLPQWKDKDQVYEVNALVDCSEIMPKVRFESKNTQGIFFIKGNRNSYLISLDWDELELEYGYFQTGSLAKVFDRYYSCPTEKKLGDIWLPFAGNIDIRTVWITYLNHRNVRNMSFRVNNCGCPSISSIFGNPYIAKVTYIYEGVWANKDLGGHSAKHGGNAVFLLSKKWKPTVEISRSKVVGLPLKLSVSISAMLNKYNMLNKIETNFSSFIDWNSVALWEWREVRDSSVGQWISENQMDHNEEIIKFVQGRTDKAEEYNNALGSIFVCEVRQVIDKYNMAFLQEHYFMEINYENGQTITFFEKENVDKGEYDIFPPMMFCKAANDQSRKYICHVNSYQRRGITADHPFIVWLLENSVKLNQHFQRQFRQIVECLCQKNAKDIVKEFGIIREQLCQMSAYYGLDAKTIPHLSREDFWPPEADKKVEQECPF